MQKAERPAAPGRMRRAAVALWLVSTAAPLAAECADLPAIRSQRYEEDYRGLADPSCRDDPLRRLKYIPIGRDGAHLSLGGETRTRIEIARNPDFGLDARRDRAVQQRLLLHADLHAAEDVRLFVQFGSFLAERRIGEAPTDVSRLDLVQAFAEAGTDLAGGRASLRAGRQEVSLGSARLISVRESPNIRRSFDGGRATWQRGDAEIEGFWMRPIALDRGVFDDASDRNEQVYGVYATLPLATAGGERGLDVYWIGYERDRARFAAGTGAETRHSLGLRLFGSAAGFDWDVEPIVQFGRFAGGRLRAWTIASDLGYRPPGVPFSPRLGLKADVASGDRDLGDRTLGTFNALYPKLPYFTEAGLAVPSNIMDLHPTVALELADRLVLELGVNFLWRHRRADAVYVPPLLPLAGSPGGSRYVGAQWEVNGEWTVRRGVELKCFFVHFAPGGAVTGLGGRGSDFLATSVALKF